ncbi:MAG: hypothetical protein WD971_02190 [Pirellulales bacterium]
MRFRNRKLQMLIGCALALVPALSSAAPFNFDDIEYWVGSGSNRAALAIDWADSTTDPPALVWGYCWDGMALGRDMLTAIVAADDRLFAKIGGSASSPVAIYGLGYDANDDGQFALDDETAFDADGFASSSPADGAVSVDTADFYAEGWFTGFWHYGQASANPYDGGSWSDAPRGMAGRELADGAWDSWTFTATFNFAAYAENPSAAAPAPYPPGDFDHDGNVTAADYDVWKSSYGSTSNLAADGNRNHAVDAGDYTVWRDHFSGESALATSGSAIPEPSSIAVILGACLTAIAQTVRARRLAPKSAPRRRG